MMDMEIEVEESVKMEIEEEGEVEEEEVTIVEVVVTEVVKKSKVDAAQQFDLFFSSQSVSQSFLKLSVSYGYGNRGKSGKDGN